MLMRAKQSNDITPLQQRIVREIVTMVRRDGLVAGDHLPEMTIAEQIGTSRSPVQAALKHLAGLGLLSRDSNRGYFLRKPAGDWSEAAARVFSKPDDPLYL